MHILSLGVLRGFPFVFKFSSFNDSIFSVLFLLLMCFSYFYILSDLGQFFSFLGFFFRNNCDASDE